MSSTGTESIQYVGRIYVKYRYRVQNIGRIDVKSRYRVQNIELIGVKYRYRVQNIGLRQDRCQVQFQRPEYQVG